MVTEAVLNKDLFILTNKHIEVNTAYYKAVTLHA